MSDEENHRDIVRVRFIVANDILNFISLVSLSAVLLTAWVSPRIRRVPTWYLYVASWDVYSVSYLLILGKQTGSEPVWGLCMFQSMMIYATPILTATSTVVFVAQIYLDIRSALGLYIPELITIKKLAFIPLVAFITILCEIAIMGFSLPDLVSRGPSGLFCRLDIVLPGRVTGVLVALCVLIMALLGASTAMTIHRNRECWQSLVGSRVFKSYGLLFRIAIFLVAPLCAIGLIVVKFLPSNSNMNTGEINILFAILPTLVGIVSCSQKDILDVWIFWRYNAVATAEDKEKQAESVSSENIAVQ